MHKLLVHASRLTLSLFSARPPLSIRRRFTADRTSHQTPHGMRLAAPCKVNEHDQVRSPERLANGTFVFTWRLFKRFKHRSRIF